MAKRLRRRQRLALVTTAAAVAFVAAVALWLGLRFRDREAYRPGEAVEGLTDELGRSLPADHPPVTFTDVSAQAGIDFRHFPGRRSSQLPEDMGSGAAWGDYDDDGWPDLYVVNMVGPVGSSPAEIAASPGRAALYHNQGDGTFREVAEAAGVAFRGWGMAAAWGDYDGDRRLDLVVTAYGSNVLYRNRGDGTFEDVTGRAGLAGPEGYWAGASWSDYDRDGDLDLYIAGYVEYDPDAVAGASRQYDVDVPAALNPSAFAPERNLLYRNDGNGRFTEVAEAAGVIGDRGRSLSAAWSDLDEDGWPDLYVTNDVSDNVLYHNRGDGTFGDVSHGALVADYRGAMGLALGDWNGDGDTDIFVTHWIAQENALYDNKVRRSFTTLDAGPSRGLQFMDEADRWGLGQIALDFVGWGTAFLDYDNDGRPDLMVVNGSTMQEPDAPHLLTPMRDLLLWNRGPGDGFYDVSAAAGPYFGESHVGRGLAVADYDRDGDLDAFIVNLGERAVLLRNDGGTGNHWLQLRLDGPAGNPTAIGARVRIVVGGAVGLQEIGAQSSYLSQHSTVAHFGLGPAARVDTLEIVWPDGTRQVFRDIPADCRLRLAEGGEPREDVPATRGAGVAAAAPVEGGAIAGAPADVGAAGDRTVGDSLGARDRVLRFWTLFRKATAERVAGRTGAAEAAYEAALALDPGHEDALYYLGSMRLQRGDFDGAREAWETLVAVNPRSGRGHGRLAALHACLAPGAPFDLDRAEAELERVLSINREQTGPLLELAVVALLRGDLPAAEHQLDRVLGSDPRSPLGQYLMGYLAWKRGGGAEAARRLEAAAEGARAAPPKAGASAEGDTRAGAGPLLAADLPCREIHAEADDLADLATGAAGDRVAEAGTRYRRLDALLERAPRR